MDDNLWRVEFRALLLEIDRHLVALDLRCWRQTAPGTSLTVTEHLQLLRARWRAVQLAPARFLPDAGPGSPSLDRRTGAGRPATVLRSWRRAGGAFPDRLAATCVRGCDDRAGSDGSAAERLARQRAAELAALRRCLAAVTAVAERDRAMSVSYAD